MNKIARADRPARFFGRAEADFLGILTSYIWAGGEIPAFLRFGIVQLLKIL
jgi:hypothetical protein